MASACTRKQNNAPRGMLNPAWATIENVREKRAESRKSIEANRIESSRPRFLIEKKRIRRANNATVALALHDLNTPRNKSKHRIKSLRRTKKKQKHFESAH